MNDLTPIRDRKIRFALVGCGRISRNHISSIIQHKDRCELVDVCDTLDSNLNETAAKTGATGYKRYDHLLQHSTADCVIIATPSGLHSQQAIAAARMGKHVMTEKPMATRWNDGIAMVTECDKAGVNLFVVKQNRRNPTLRALKRVIQEKRFGKIYSVSVNVFWARPQEYYDSADWRGTWEFDGGAFMNQASHYIDLLDWLVGPVESVMCYTGTLGRNIEVEDTGVAALRWRCGAMGTVNVTMLTYPQNLEGSITICGELGTARIGGVAANRIEKWDFADKSPDDEGVHSLSYDPKSVYGYGHPLYYDNVINTLMGTEKAETDGREGLKSLEILIAMYLSARDAKRVALPLEY